MADSLIVRRDKRVDSIQYRMDHATCHQYKNEKYFDNWTEQDNLVVGDSFQVQIIANGNTITFSWPTVVVTANADGDVTDLIFITKIPANFLPFLVGGNGDGQNFPIYVDNSTNYILWVDADGTIRIAPTQGNLNPIAASNATGTVWGGSVTWTTDN